MKKTLLFASAAVLLCGCGTGSKYVVEGHIAGLEGTVYLFQQDSLIDSAVVKSGKFRFSGPAGAPAMHDLLDSRDGQPQAFAMQLILEPGTISIKSDADDPQVRHTTGTPANDAAEAYTAASRALITEYRDAATTDQRREAIEEEFEQLTRTSVEANRDNFFGVMLMPNMAYELSGQELLDEIAKFPAEMQQTDALVRLKENAEQMIKTDIGQPFIDIAQPNADGEQVSLESVVRNPANKYVLLDFWASWCGPCMGEVPHLKKTYDEFRKKGFEIYGVSFDEDRGDWLGAVEQNGMNWLHVSEVKGFDNQAAKDYAIQGIPSNFLIDGQGTIVARNLRGEALYEKISELLAQ